MPPLWRGSAGNPQLICATKGAWMSKERRMAEELLDVSTPEGRRDAMALHGVTPAQLAGISSDELEAIYSLAVEDLASSQFDQAMDRLVFLVSHDPWERRYQVAFAHALQSLGQWESALQFYTEALLTDATDAACAYRAGECLVALADFEGAREAFAMAVSLSWIHPGQDSVRQAASQCLDQLAARGV